MRSQLKPLPILEHWDCHQCAACCREATIQLNSKDLARLQQQRWGQHPEFQGRQIVRRSAWFFGPRVLAHQEDGSCVFLTDAGRCRIHELFGADAKPFMCRLFPLQVVATDRAAYATIVRSCPSAAADHGRPLSEHLAFLKRLRNDNAPGKDVLAVPPIVRRTVRSWDDFHRVADGLQRLLVDDRMPLVRRLVHCLRFCSLLEQCKWNRVKTESVTELIEVLEQAADHDVGPLFQERRPPARSAARLFRRLGAHFIQCFPGGRPTRTLFDHLRVFRISGRFARATTLLPEMHPQFPAVAMEVLERPLGPLASDVLHPVDRFYESHAMSKRYILADPGSSVVDSVRRLAFVFPMSLWMLRWLTAEREPTAENTVQIVVAMERGLMLSALNHAARFLAGSGELERLIAWYGR